MAEYNDELKSVRKMLRSEMRKAGIKDFSIRGQGGTGYGWTDIAKNPKKDGYGTDWTARDQAILKDFNFHVGHPSNSLMTSNLSDIKSKLYGYKAKPFKAKPKYKKFVEDFMHCARQQKDEGTCVGGAGTFIMKDGVPIDKIRQQGQSESRNWVAQKIMKDRARLLGVELKHEGGWMD